MGLLTTPVIRGRRVPTLSRPVPGLPEKPVVSASQGSGPAAGPTANMTGWKGPVLGFRGTTKELNRWGCGCKSDVYRVVLVLVLDDVPNCACLIIGRETARSCLDRIKAYGVYMSGYEYGISAVRVAGLSV